MFFKFLKSFSGLSFLNLSSSLLQCVSTDGACEGGIIEIKTGSVLWFYLWLGYKNLPFFLHCSLSLLGTMVHQKYISRRSGGRRNF